MRGKIRVSGGSMKGKAVSARRVGGESVHGALRATPAKVRAAVFNIIGPGINGSVFADLYAGTGAIGMEAMSRGAASVYFVEADRLRAQELAKTLDGCGCQVKATISAVDVSQFLKRARGLDYVFLDPPYDSAEIEKVLPVLGTAEALSEDAVVIAEHRQGTELPERVGLLVKAKSYKYGDTCLAKYVIERE